MIVPFAPGGGADLGSRVVADKIAEFLGQPLISVYKPGGGGTLGTSFVAKAKPDGYTLLGGGAAATLTLFPVVKRLDYKLDDFVLLGGFGKVPHWLVVKTDAKWRSLKEFVEEEKKSLGSLKVGSYGKLTTAEFIIELLNKHAGIKLTHIPYKSSGEALTSVLGRHIDAAMVTGAGGLLESGQVRILAVAEEQRLEGLADVPTFKEFGYSIVLSARYCFAFPKGTPKEIVEIFTKAREEAFKRYPEEIKEALRRVEIWAENDSPKDITEKFEKDYVLLLKSAQELGYVTK